MLPREGERHFDKMHPGRSTNLRMINSPHLYSKHTEYILLRLEDWGMRTLELDLV